MGSCVPRCAMLAQNTVLLLCAQAKWTMNVGQTCVCPDYILVTKANEAKVR